MLKAMKNDCASGVTQYYFQRNYSNQGDCFLVLAGRRWNPFLLRQAGVQGQPFFKRDSLPHEPETFKNGHPYAWLYRNPEDLLKDEKRWLDEKQLEAFSQAVSDVMASTEVLHAAETQESDPSMNKKVAPMRGRVMRSIVKSESFA
jgi:hypothetical protein